MVQPPVFVTASLKGKLRNCFHLVACWPVTPSSIKSVKHKICASQITLNVGPHSWFKYGYFFLLYGREPILPLTLVVALHSSLPAIVRYLQPGDWKDFVVPFLHIQSSLDKSLIEKPTIVLVVPLWCDTVTWDSSRTVVVIKLLRTSAL